MVAKTLPPKGARWKRVVGRSLAAVGLMVVFTISAAVGLVLHIDIEASRSVIARLGSEALSGEVYGDIKIDRIEHVHVDEVVASAVTVRDEQGRKVLAVSKLRILADIPVVIRKLVLDEGKISVVFEHVRAESADVELIPDPKTGEPTVARALTPIPKKKPTKPSKTPKRIRVWLPTIELGQVWARGTVGDLPMMEATLRAVKGSLLVSPKGLAVDVQRFGAVVRGLGGADATGTGSLHVRAPGRVWSYFDGFFGDVEVGAFVEVHGKKIKGRLDLPNAKPESLRALVPEWPLHEDVTANLQIEGTLPTLDATGHFGIGSTVLATKGKLSIAGDVGANLSVDASGVDIRAMWPDAPETSAHVDTSLELWIKQGKLTADVNGKIAPTIVAGQVVPAIDVLGRVEKGGFKGRINVHEPGMPVRAQLTVHANGTVDIDADARTFFIQSAPRLRRFARGRANVRVLARVAKNEIDARVTAKVNGFELGDVKLGSGRLEAHARGPVDDIEKLHVDASLAGSSFAAGLFSFESVSAHARGNVRTPRVRASFKDRYGPSVQAAGVVSSKGKTRVRDLSLAVQRGDAKLVGSVARLEVGRGEIDVDRLALAGAGGDLRGSLSVRPESVTVDLHGQGVDLSAMSQALGLGRGTLDGIITIDADATATKDAINGTIRVGLGNASIYSLPGVSMQVDGRFDGSGFDGSASGVVENIGAFGAVWDTDLPGSPLEAESWRAALGRATVKLSNVELSYLTHVLPKSLGIQRVEGKFFGDFRIDRDTPQPLPNVLFVAETKGVEVVKSVDEGKKTVVISGMDLQAGGSFHGQTGRSEGTTRLVHAGSVLAALSGSLDIDIQELLRAPGKIGPQLLDTPVDAVLTVEGRQFKELPELIRPEGIVGSIDTLRIAATGVPRKPNLSGIIAIGGLTQAGRPNATPLRVVARPRYSPGTGDVGGSVAVYTGDKRVGSVQVGGNVSWEELTRKDDGTPRDWSAAAEIEMTGLPLSVVPDLADEGIGGELFGKVRIARKDGQVQLAANVGLQNAEVAEVRIGNGQISIEPDGDVFLARAKLERGTGTLGITARAGVTWPGELPELDEARPISIGLHARRLDAVVLSPFFGDALSELTGELDSNLSFHLRALPDPEDAGKMHWTGPIKGDAKLRHGVVQVAAVGLELRETSFDAKIQPRGGLTVVTTENIRAKARSKTVNLNARARLVFDGARLIRGSAGLGASEVPLLVEGVSLGKASGVATAELSRQSNPDLLFVRVVVPQGTVKLPRSASRNVISLKENSDIRIVQFESDETQESTLPWRVVLDLGGIRMRRGDLDIPVRGQPVINIAEETTVTGYVELPPGGHMPALGKVFTIESGLVRFDTGDPTNPRLQVTASWRAPDATIVYVDVTGTLEEAKLATRSVPSKTRAEILALLLGGSNTGAQQDDPGNPGAVVSAGIGGVLGLSEVLSDTPYELRADSTAEGRQALTGAYRKGNVTAEVTYAPPGGNAIGEEEDRFIVTTDLRFTERWSVRYQIGTATLRQQIDLLWQYRY